MQHYNEWLVHLKDKLERNILYKYVDWGARGVMVIVVGNGHGDTSSKPGRDRLHFT